MWVSHQEQNFSTMSFEPFEPCILLLGQLFSPSRSSLCFLSGETRRRGADSSIAGGKTGWSHQCLWAGEEHPLGLRVCKQIKPRGARPRCSSIHEQPVPTAKPSSSLPIHNPGRSASPKHSRLSPIGNVPAVTRIPCGCTEPTAGIKPRASIGQRQQGKAIGPRGNLLLRLVPSMAKKLLFPKNLRSLCLISPA